MFEEIPKNCRYGYVRVSFKSQEENSSLESQKKELLRHGVPQKNIRIEIGSTADPIWERPVFYHLIENELKQNDWLLVNKIDRCSRNTLDFLKLQEKLLKKSVRFISFDLPYPNDRAHLIATAIATFENERQKDRQRQGIKAAKAAGKYIDRKTVIHKKLIDEVKNWKEKKNLSVTEIDRVIGIISKVLKNELGYVSNRFVKQEKRNEANEINFWIRTSSCWWLMGYLLSFKS